MAASVNKVILLGNVGKDPEFKSLPSGTPVANFSLATSKKFKDSKGESQERTEWHNCQAFGRVAEIVRDYVKKGHKLYAEGEIQTRSWEDKNTGEKKYRTEILIFQVSLLSGNGESGSTSGEGNTDQQQRRGANSSRQVEDFDQYAADLEITDDDIPF